MALCRTGECRRVPELELGVNHLSSGKNKIDQRKSGKKYVLENPDHTPQMINGRPLHPLIITRDRSGAETHSQSGQSHNVLLIFSPIKFFERDRN